MKKIINFLLIISITSVSSCSLDSLTTSEAVLGGGAGALAGAGIGSIIGDRIGKKTENMAMIGGIGAGTGILLGSLIHDNRAEANKEKAEIIRRAGEISQRQKQIDKLREQVQSDSSWGRSEVKPWSERYETEVSDYPFQGISLK